MPLPRACRKRHLFSQLFLPVCLLSQACLGERSFLEKTAPKKAFSARLLVAAVAECERGRCLRGDCVLPAPLQAANQPVQNNGSSVPSSAVRPLEKREKYCHLPRQARDKAYACCYRSVGYVCIGIGTLKKGQKTAFFVHFLYQNDHSAKTGSGQTKGKLKKEWRFSHQRLQRG